MAIAVLHPCKVREDRIVPERESESATMTMVEILEKFVPLRRGDTEYAYKRRIQSLLQMKPGAFVGLARDHRRGLVHFVLSNRDSLDNRFRWLMKKNPLFFKNIEEVYRVESIEWEGRWEVL